MEAISFQEIGLYLTISSAFLGACWLLVRSGQDEMRKAMDAHMKAERQTMAHVDVSITAAAQAAADLTPRVAALEAQVNQLPGHEDVYRVGLCVERLIARLDSQDRIIARLDTITQRQEDYLLSRSR